MRGRTSRRFGWTGFGLVAVMLVVGLVVPRLAHLTGVHDAGPLVLQVGTGLAFVSIAFVAALIATKQPSNALWYVLMLDAVATMTSFTCDAFSTQALDRGTHALLPRVAASISNVTGGALGLLFLALILLLFPDGRAASSRWRRLVRFTIVWSVLFAAADIVLPGPLPNISTKRPVTNVFGVRALAPLRAIIFGPGFFIVLALVVAGAVSIVFRYRRARSVERQQIKFVLLAAMIVAVIFIGGPLYFWRATAPSWAWNVAFMIAVLSLPVTLGAAILRYRLYDIDRLISRTASYLVVSAILVGLFALIVLIPTAVIGSRGTSPSWLIAVATLAVALLFQPVRRRVQNVVDRRFNRARYDASHTIEAFVGRLREEVDLEALRSELSDVVARTMQPSRVGVWLAPSKRS